MIGSHKGTSIVEEEEVAIALRVELWSVEASSIRKVRHGYAAQLKRPQVEDS